MTDLLLTEEEQRFIPVEPLSHRLPIYVCSRDMSQGLLHDFFVRNKGVTHLISNADEIERSITSIYRRLRYEKPLTKFRDGLANLLEPFSVSYKDFSISVSRAAANRKPADNMHSSGPLLYIKEDSIQPRQVIKLASLYQELPSEVKPLIFFEPNDRTLSLSAELDKLNERLVLIPIGQTKHWRTSGKLTGNTGISQFLDNFLSHSYSACEQAEPITTENFSKHNPEEIVRRLSSESLIIKSYDAMGDKFLALPVARDLLAKIEIAREYMKDDSQMRYLLSLRAVVNLWMAYIDESYTEGIDNSLAIAEFLHNDFLRAHCFRLAHLVSGYGQLTGAMVAKAVEYFQRTEDHEAYVYSKNNYLLNQLHLTAADTDAFAELAEFAIHKTPYLDRLSTIINNAGTAYLVNGQFDDAEEMYNKAKKFSGQNIHHIGIEVNKFIVRHMRGECISEDEIMQLHRRIVRANLPAQYAYHQSYIHWTLAKLAGPGGRCIDDIFAHLSEMMFMPYESVLKRKQTMVEYLADSQIYNKGRGQFAGPRGNFIHRTELFPIVHFQWM